MFKLKQIEQKNAINRSVNIFKRHLTINKKILIIMMIIIIAIIIIIIIIIISKLVKDNFISFDLTMFYLT